MYVRCLSIVVVSLALSACGSSGGGDGGGALNDAGSAGTTGTSTISSDTHFSDTSAIAGIWDQTDNGDVYYQVISADGRVSEYDYQGDSAGSGDNCYRLAGSFNISHEGDDVYTAVGLVATMVVDNAGDLVVEIGDSGRRYAPVHAMTESDLNLCQ